MRSYVSSYGDSICSFDREDGGVCVGGGAAEQQNHQIQNVGVSWFRDVMRIHRKELPPSAVSPELRWRRWRWTQNCSALEGSRLQGLAPILGPACTA